MKALIAMAALVAGLALLGACGGGGSAADEYSQDQGSRLAGALSQIVERPDLQHLNASDTVMDVCVEALRGHHSEGGKRIKIAKELHDVCSEVESASALPAYQALPRLIEARRHLLDWLWE